MFSNLLFGSDDSDSRFVLQLMVAVASWGGLAAALTQGWQVGATVTLPVMAFAVLFSRLRAACDRVDELGGMDARVARRIDRHERRVAATVSAQEPVAAVAPQRALAEAVAA
jgi:hypothetical protein